MDASRKNRWKLGSSKRVVLHASPPMPVHLNGEPVGTTPASFELEPGGLELVGRPYGASSDPAS